MKIIVLIARIIQAIFALLTLGFAIAVVNWFNTKSGKASPGAFNVLVAVPLVAILALFYLEVVPRIAPSASHPIPSLVCEALPIILYLAGCGVAAHFVMRLETCIGIICTCAKAAPTFAGLSVPLWIFTTILMVKQIFTHGFRRPSASRPAMSQA